MKGGGARPAPPILPMRTIHTVVAVSAALLAAGSWVVFGSSPQPAAETEEDISKQLDALERSLAENTRNVRRAQALAQVANHTAAEAREMNATVTPVAEEREEEFELEHTGDDESASPERELEPREISERLDARFFAEPIGADWGADAIVQAREVGAVLGRDGRVATLECRESMCRLSTSHPDLESFHASLEEAFHAGEGGWLGPFMATVMSDPMAPGEIESVVYLAREGVDLSPSALY